MLQRSLDRKKITLAQTRGNDVVVSCADGAKTITLPQAATPGQQLVFGPGGGVVVNDVDDNLVLASNGHW